jgi:choline dehydrogenase-like flavoprotein
MVYIRGNAADFDGWNKDGAPGWSYQEMLRYFIRSEGNERGDELYHGYSGPLSVRDPRYQHPLVDRFIQAGQQAGLSYNDDFNGPTQMGIGRFQLTQRNGERWSAADAYLHPARERSNLTVLTGALALRVVLESGRAKGVFISRYGNEETLWTNREVIICAGALNSPQILMLSGIGPASDLKMHGITPVVDLPVGMGLRDHVLVPLAFETSEPSLRADSPADLELYERERRGPLTSNLVEGGAFLSSQPGHSIPDIELYMVPGMARDALPFTVQDAFAILASIIQNSSSGKVTLRSARPDAKPKIYCNLLSTPEDRITAIAAVRAVMNIVSQQPLASVRRSNLLAPAGDSDAVIWEYLEQSVLSDRHEGCSCAMGPVLDPALKVHGIEALRVVDASAMPSVPRGNINAVVIAIAEKAADLIRASS